MGSIQQWSDMLSQNDGVSGRSEYDSKFERQRSRTKETIVKIVVIGGSGLIGSKLVPQLREGSVAKIRSKAKSVWIFRGRADRQE